MTIVDIHLTPAKSTLTIVPNESAWQKVVVKNNGDPLTVKPDVYPFYSADSAGNIRLTDSLLVYDPYSDLNRISISYPMMDWGKSVTLDRDEERTFVFKYTASASPQAEKYFFIAFTVENDTSGSSKGIVPAVTIGTPVMISQIEPGTVSDQKPKIKDFKVTGISDSLFPITARASVENSGANYYNVKGYWEVVPVIGGTKKYPITNDTILTKGIRNIRCNTADDNCRLYPTLPIGIFKVRLVLENDQGIIMYKREKAVVVLPLILISALGALSFLFRSIVNKHSTGKNGSTNPTPPTKKTKSSTQGDF